MSAGPGLAELLADRSGTVLLAQASTPTEARLIRDRIAAAGGTDQPPVSLGPPGDATARLPQALLDGDPDVRLVPVRVAWLPEERAGRRAARLADILPGHDPYHPNERQQQRILARQPGRATVLIGEPATLGLNPQQLDIAGPLFRSWPEDHGRYHYVRLLPGDLVAQVATRGW